MKQFTVSAVVLALVACASFAVAEEKAKTKSGLKSGASIGAFYVKKLAGAESDGVKTGQNLCYRCKNGQRPQVMVFTRSSDKKVVKLVQALDAAIKKHSKEDLRAFVNYLGEDKTDAASSAKKLAAASKAKNVPFVLPNEFENGPDNYGLNAKVDVTIIMAEGGKVKANHAFTAGKDVNVDEVVKSLKKILN